MIIAALALVVTFVAGFVAGVVVDRVVVWHRGPGHPPPLASHVMIGRLDHHLDLTDQQRAEIEKIIERRHERMNQLMAGMRPRMDAEIAETNAEIEKVLTPEQRAKFQDLKLRLGPHGRHGGRGRRGSTR